MYPVVLTITPETAFEMLKHRNPNNRKCDSHKVSMYAEAMQNGRWKLNGESISFNKNGQLVNGEHRLRACVQSQTPFETLVAYDVENDVVIFDTGKARTTSDVLYMGDIKASVNMIGIFNFLLDFHSYRPSKDFILEKIPAVIESLHKAELIMGGKSGNGCKTQRSEIGAAIWVYLQNGTPENELRRFFKIVNTGFCDDNSERAAVVCRNYIIQTQGYAATRENRKKRFEIVCKALNDFLKQKPRIAGYRVEGNAEDFYKGTLAEQTILKLINKTSSGEEAR